MITQTEAQQIAERFLRLKKVEVEGIASIKLITDSENRDLWICSFLNVMPPDVLDSPGVTIVEVDSITGEASLFDAL